MENDDTVYYKKEWSCSNFCVIRTTSVYWVSFICEEKKKGKVKL